MNTIKPHCYSQRMLNPFRGVMNIIETGCADAVTTDGVHWTLYLRDEALQGMANDGRMDIEVLDIRFGIWSKTKGLKRAPLLNTMEYKAVQKAGYELLEVVKQYSGQIPFALADRFELWLLDKYMDEPLALVDSKCYASDITTTEHIPWTTGIFCRKNFHSEFLASQNILDSKINHAEWLKQQVNNATGHQPRVQWFYRDTSRNGIGLACSQKNKILEGRIVNKWQFPKFLVNHKWLDAPLTIVIDEYLAWQAPWLLLLEHMSDSIRGQLEKLACKQALQVEALQHLYPKTINHQCITTARIEARLRNSDCSGKQPKDIDETIQDTYLASMLY